MTNHLILIEKEQPVNLGDQTLFEEDARNKTKADHVDSSITTSISKKSIKERRFFSLPKVERQGIQPVPEDERPHTRKVDNFTLWFSINTNWIPLSLGMLATQIYHINFWQGLVCIILANMIVAIPGKSIFTTFGSQYGLRQIVITRYSYGLIPCHILTSLNIIAFIGWGVIDTILGAQLLASIQLHNNVTVNFPLWVAVLVIIVGTLVITIFGYHMLHFFERWTWLPLWIMFFIILGLSVHHIDLSATSSNTAEDIGDVISFFTTMASAFPIWVQCAADFTVKQPANSNRLLIAVLNYFGAIIPTILLEIFGLALGTAIAEPTQNPTWEAAYDSDNVGGLAAAILEPLSGFGKFCLVLSAFGMIVHVAPNSYGCALQVQSLVPGFYKIPIWIFILVVTTIIAVASIAGSENLASIIQTVLPLQVYYIGPYVTVLLVEHYVFRRGHYPVEIWNSRKELPIGLAATFITMGAYGIAFLGANQSWFSGPAAKHISDHGGEIGLWITFVFAVFFYPPARYIEKRIFGR
ncbi:permease for cytosine/purines, uracil, thiamine, allantoin-domain-containing protein, partial [Phascolomyces articulosus]